MSTTELEDQLAGEIEDAILEAEFELERDLSAEERESVVDEVLAGLDDADTDEDADADDAAPATVSHSDYSDLAERVRVLTDEVAALRAAKQKPTRKRVIKRQKIKAYSPEGLPSDTLTDTTEIEGIVDEDT